MQSQFLRQFSEFAAKPQAALILDEPTHLRPLLKKHKISESEYRTILQILGRRPTLAELGVFSAMWSEHCSYKSSRVHLKKLPTEGECVVVGPGENAGVVRLSGKLCAAFKMESHNHPSYIEPYQGAATGVGGILRDVFCMGARPVANLNALRFGSRDHPRTHYLFANVVKGIGDYGNCVGIPTVAGSISFDKTYNGNILVNAMTVGLIHEDRIFKGYATGKHNLVVYVGSATGRDGIHGASMASDSFSSAQSGERSTVQVGDPFAEKLLLEATLEVLDRGLVVGLQDMGAAGLTSSSFEMADRAGNGLYLNLDYVPTRAKAMTAYELLLSESQERMLMCVEPAKWEDLKACLARWELPFAVIGIVTDTGRMQIVKDGVAEVDLPVAPLAESAPKYTRPYQIEEKLFADDIVLRQKLADTPPTQLLSMILREDGDKAVVYKQYDHHIGNKTVLGPEELGAGVLWIRSEWADSADQYLGLVVSTACNERYCEQDPRLGAAHAVLKCFRSIAATGGLPLAITDCLNYGNPEDPKVMGQIVAGIEGISLACKALNTPVVSGNVSLYNETDGKSIAPTPMIGMVGKHSDVRKALKATIDAEGDIYIIRPKALELSLGGALVTKVLGVDLHTEALPSIDWAAERQAAELIGNLMNSGKLSAARDVGAGGPLACLAKMLVPRGFGGKFTIPKIANVKKGSILYFGESSSSYIIQAKAGQDILEDVEGLQHIDVLKLGTATRSSTLSCDEFDFDVTKLQADSAASLGI